MRRVTPFQWAWMAAATIAIGLGARFAVEDISLLRRTSSWLMDIAHAGFRTQPTATRDDIVLVSITPESLAGLPYREPIDSAWLAELVSRIAASRPKLIALDLVPSATEPAKDRRLAEAAKAAGLPIVVGWTEGATPAPVFAGAGWSEGDNAPLLDESGLWRRMSPGETGADGVTRLGFPNAVLEAIGARWEDLYGSAIDYLRPAADSAGLFRTLPAVAAALRPELLRDRIVLVGSALDHRDVYRTPLTALHGEKAGSLSHLEIQAQSIAQLLDHRPRRAIGSGPALLLCLLGAGLGLLLQAAALPRLRHFLGLLLVLSTVVLTAALAVRFAGIDIPLLAPLIAFLAGLGVARLGLARGARDNRALLAGSFAGIIAPAIAQRILGDKSGIGLTGRTCDAVVLRLEIAHLDPLAETLPPAELVATVAALQKRLTALALDHEGTITHHLPSGLAVLFGAPVPVSRAGEKALRCAQAMLLAAAAAAEGKGRDVPALGLRIALHAGAVITGDFCGGAKPLYDGVGRTMAIADLMLNLCPVLGVPLIATYDAAGRVPGTTFRPIGTFELPDWQGQIEVFIPLRPGESKSPVAAAYLKGIEALHRGNLDAARSAFSGALEADPADGPARYHLLRLEAGNSGTRLPWPLPSAA